MMRGPFRLLDELLLPRSASLRLMARRSHQVERGLGAGPRAFDESLRGVEPHVHPRGIQDDGLGTGCGHTGGQLTGLRDDRGCQRLGRVQALQGLRIAHTRPHRGPSPTTPLPRQGVGFPTRAPTHILPPQTCIPKNHEFCRRTRFRVNSSARGSVPKRNRYC